MVAKQKIVSQELPVFESRKERNIIRSMFFRFFHGTKNGTCAWIPPYNCQVVFGIPTLAENNKVIFSIYTGRIDSIVVAKGITEYTLNYLQPSTEYEISLKSIKGREESEPLLHTMYTGMRCLFENIEV